MLAIGRALVTNPKIILLDEPSEGLSPVTVEPVVEIYRELMNEDIALLLVVQNILCWLPFSSVRSRYISLPPLFFNSKSLFRLLFPSIMVHKPHPTEILKKIQKNRPQIRTLVE